MCILARHVPSPQIVLSLSESYRRPGKSAKIDFTEMTPGRHQSEYEFHDRHQMRKHQF